MPSAAGRILIALSIGAVLGLLLILAYYLSDDRIVRERALNLAGQRLVLISGQGEQTAGGLRIKPLGRELSTLALASNIQLAAERYSAFRWELEGIDKTVRVYLAWVKQGAPEQLIEAPLEHIGLAEGRVELTGIPAWQGEIVAVGLRVQGPLVQALTIKHIALEPPPLGALEILAALWHDWTAFEGWQAHSINFIFGGTQRALVPPLVAGALWCVLSLIVYAVLVRLDFGSGTFGFAAAMIFLAAWLLLDLRWQIDMGRQLSDTYAAFAGKTLEQKRLADQDGDLYRFIAEIRQKLPDTPNRIFLVSADPNGASYFARARAHYHLLPHNVYSGLTEPPTRGTVEAGDFILILTPIDGIAYDSQRQLLRWDEDEVLWAIPIYNAEAGVLLQVAG